MRNQKVLKSLFLIICLRVEILFVASQTPMNTHDSGLAHGTSGSPQTTIDNHSLEHKVNELKTKPKYLPTKKHDVGGFGSPNPVKTQKEGQMLLNTGYKDGKQIYNITENGHIVKFQPDNTPSNGYHCYGVSTFRDIPTSILKKMLNDNKITYAEYKKIMKGKR